MELKKLKDIRESGKILLSLPAGTDKVEVKETLGVYYIYINDLKVETFRTKETALEVANEAAQALGT
jgi:hypothetical protein